MSRKGKLYDNACAETFFATLKKVLIYHRYFMNKKEDPKIVNWYIYSLYNENKRCSKNSYQFEHRN